MKDKNIKLHSGRDTEEFRRAEKRGKKFQKGSKSVVILGILLVLTYFSSVLFFVDYSANNFSIAWVIKIANQNIHNFYQFIIGNGTSGGIQFIVYRYAIIALVGGVLSVCGSVFQGVFRNGLASPTTLGVEAGGSVGNIIYVLLFVSAGTEIRVLRASDYAQISESIGVLGRNLQQLIVLAGCFLGVFIIISISTAAGRGKLSSSAMILSSMLFSSLISTFSSLIQYILIMNNPYDPRIDYLRGLSMGNFDRSFSMEHLLMIAPVLIICVIVLLLLCAKMNVFAFGEEEAKSMGMNVKAFKYTVIGIGTIMTAVVLAYCGQIGFIGFIVPHIARKITGPDFKKLVPGSLFLGAMLMIIVYDIAKFVHLSSYINLITSIIGSMIMLVILIRQRRGKNASFAE